MIEFRIQRQCTDAQQDKRDIRVHNVGQNVLFQRHVVILHGFAYKIERDRLAIESLHRLTLHLLEQIFFTRGDVVDQVL